MRVKIRANYDGIKDQVIFSAFLQYIIFAMTLAAFLFFWQTQIFIYWSFNYRSYSFISKTLNYAVFFETNIKVIYLAFVDGKAIMTCLIKHQLINHLFNINIYLNINFFIF